MVSNHIYIYIYMVYFIWILYLDLISFFGVTNGSNGYYISIYLSTLRSKFCGISAPRTFRALMLHADASTNLMHWLRFCQLANFEKTMDTCKNDVNMMVDYGSTISTARKDKKRQTMDKHHRQLAVWQVICSFSIVQRWNPMAPFQHGCHWKSS